jgi:hypothetical protein
MAAKHFTLRKVTTSISLFLSIFLMAFSCADHVVPETPATTQIRTLDVSIGFIFGLNAAAYGVQFESFGNVPVVEYGIVRVLGASSSAPATPTIADTKIVSNDPLTLTDRYVSEAFNPLNVQRLSYRAYALLQNGDVVYGEVKSRLNIPDNPIEPKIKTLDAVANAGNSMRFSVSLEEAGNIPASEFGVLYSIGNAPTPPAQPTEVDDKVIFTGALTTNPSNKDTNINGMGLFVYYRAYAKLVNGNTIYGEVKTTGTMPL